MMPQYRVCFRVEQTLSGSIEIEAETHNEAKRLFEAATGQYDGGHYTADQRRRFDEIDDARRDGKLDLEDSEDSVVEVQDAATREGSLDRNNRRGRPMSAPEFPIHTLKRGDRVEVDLKPATVITVHSGYVVVRFKAGTQRNANARVWPEEVQRKL